MTSSPRQATSCRARLAGTALLTTCALAVTATTGCGLAMRKGSQKAVQIAAEAVLGETASRFFDSIGQDRAGMRSQDGGRTSGDSPGLYATVPDIPACDRGMLTDLLTRDPAKAAAWARTVGITPAEIGPFLGSTTPVLLGSDTLVRNHRFENGAAVPYPALLQAGTAVLVDPWGRPVAKCGCGNPLTQLSPVPDKFEPQGMPAQWQGVYRSSAVVAVTAAGAQVTRFTLADATTPGRAVIRPTGTGGEADTMTVAPPAKQPPSEQPPPEQPPTKQPPSKQPPVVTPTRPTTIPTIPPTRTAPTVTATRPTTIPTIPTGGPTRPVAQPRLTLSTSSVAIGDSYVARASGFAPGEPVRFAWTGPNNGTITTATADTTGAAAVSVREGADPGDYRIHATGATSGRTANAPLRVVR